MIHKRISIRIFRWTHRVLTSCFLQPYPAQNYFIPLGVQSLQIFITNASLSKYLSKNRHDPAHGRPGSYFLQAG